MSLRRWLSSCFLISKEIFKSIKKTLSTWSSLVVGQNISFLTKHTWLMNFAVVAFLMEKFLRRNRQRFQIYSPVKGTAPTTSIALFMSWLVVAGWSGWQGGGWVGRRLLFHFHCLLVNGIRWVIVWRVNFGRNSAMRRNPTFFVSLFTSLFNQRFMFGVACLSLLL